MRRCGEECEMAWGRFASARHLLVKNLLIHPLGISPIFAFFLLGFKNPGVLFLPLSYLLLCRCRFFLYKCYETIRRSKQASTFWFDPLFSLFCSFTSQSVEVGLSGTSQLWWKKAEKKQVPVKCVEKVPCQGSLLRSVAHHQRQNRFSALSITMYLIDIWYH